MAGALFLSGAPRRIRTSDIQIRSLALYPAEPWALYNFQTAFHLISIKQFFSNHGCIL